MDQAEPNTIQVTEPQIDAVEEIRRDLNCPQCEYNLRGLQGANVVCPECGISIDVAALVQAEWAKPWFKAPGLNRVFRPVLVMVLWLLLAFVVAIVVGSYQYYPAISDASYAFIAVMLVGLGLWFFTMYRSYQLFNSMEGVWLSLLSHALLAGYLAGVWSFLGSLITLVLFFTWSSIGPTFGEALPAFIVLVISAGVIWVCRRGEKFIAGRCIRRHLQVQAGSD